jgi:hypothetical protein
MQVVIVLFMIVSIVVGLALAPGIGFSGRPGGAFNALSR